MNRRAFTAGAAALVLGALTTLPGCTLLRMQSAEPPRVSITSMTLTDLSLFEQRFAVGLRLQNPNEFPLPITGFDYALALNDEPFATGVSDQSVTVPALGEAEVVVHVTSNLLDTLDQFRRWQQNPPEVLDYALTGRLSLADVPVRLPFEYTGEVDLNLSSP
jgi:LEA14-like dessication related protein